MLARGLRCLSVRWAHSNIQKPLDIATTSVVPGSKEAWERRLELRKPKLQRDEVLSAKVYYAPEWELDKKPNKDAGFPDPLKNYGITPEKWEYYNKVHFSPKRMWQACQLVWRTNVDEAITQLQFQQLKSCKILAEVLTEAKERATNEFHIEFPSDMYVADAFPVQSNIIKGARRHAHENWCTIRYRYIHIFVRLEEMVNVKKGVLVTCDPAMRQLLMHLDESRTLGSKFIVKELDETHLFIDREIVRILEEKLDHLMEQMNPELSDK
ncbi:REX1 DNA Repair [Ancylostoma ceylanicum]|uniref:Large ribosomal subunit protein uL22m n=1 Tax=Ancylostoma ceylanicum TaxID=53326 RepID=A0A0D6LRB0_9BILA|nr:REX1 DNA Repair [Ancylostoma ceylanicum]